MKNIKKNKLHKRNLDGKRSEPKHIKNCKHNFTSV